MGEEHSGPAPPASEPIPPLVANVGMQPNPRQKSRIFEKAGKWKRKNVQKPPPNHSPNSSRSLTMNNNANSPSESEPEEEEEEEDYLFRCAICQTTEGDSSNLASQITLQTNATVGCGHQL